MEHKEMKKVVLITGSSTGFGRLAAEKLARRGHAVFATMRGLHGKNSGVAAELEKLAQVDNLALYPLELDVTDEASVDAAMAEIIRRESRIDVVINNAGFAMMGLAETVTPGDMTHQFDTNVLGPQRVNRAALPHMRGAGSGRMIHISSIIGRLVLPGMSVYCASKFALEAMTEGLRLELAPLGIESTLIEPGAYPTEIFGKIGDTSDGARAEGYGPLAGLSDQLKSGIGEALSSPDAGNPNEVVDVMVAQVEAAPGTLPFRTVVGADAAPVTALNDVAERSQMELLERFGLAEIAKAAQAVNPTGAAHMA